MPKKKMINRYLHGKEGGCLTCEPISKCSFYSVENNKDLSCFPWALMQTTSSLQQLSAKKLSYHKKLMDELHGHRSFMLFQVSNTTIIHLLLRKCKNINTFWKTRTLIQWSSRQLLDLVEVNYKYKTSGKLSIIPKA